LEIANRGAFDLYEIVPDILLASGASVISSLLTKAPDAIVVMQCE